MTPLVLIGAVLGALALSMAVGRKPSGQKIVIVPGRRYRYTARVTPVFADKATLDSFKKGLEAGGAKIFEMVHSRDGDGIIITYELTAVTPREFYLGDVALQIGRHSFTMLDVVQVPGVAA